MEDTLLGLVLHAKKGVDDAIRWVEGIPVVGSYMHYLAYGFSIYALGHFVLGWW